MTATRTPRPDPEPKPMNREQGVLGILQLPAFGLAVAASNIPEGKTRTALLADSATITEYGPGIAKGFAEAAANDPKLAAVLDKVIALGPYSAILVPVGQMMLQIAANHERVPAGTGGTVTAEQMIAKAFITEATEDAASETEPSSNGRASANIPA